MERSERISNILLAAGLVMCLGLGSYRWYSKLHPHNAEDAWANFRARVEARVSKQAEEGEITWISSVMVHSNNPIVVNIPMTTPNGLPSNVVIRSDGTHFAWDDINPNRYWDSTLASYGIHVKFNTYQEALDSAKNYVSAMNAEAEQARKRGEEAKKGQEVTSWPIVK